MPTGSSAFAYFQAVMWDAKSGGVVLPLSEHKKSVRALSWRSDSGVVASCGEDGTIVWWDVKNGWPVMNKPNAHGGGVLDVVFGPAGELASCGCDGQAKAAPGVKLLPTRVALSADGSFLLAGDTAGQLHAWPTK